MSAQRHGFSLLELLCALAVVAVLAACAVPTHRAASIRARRTDARIALLGLASLQERHYFQHGRYAASLAELGVTAARSSEGFYRLGVRAAASGQGFIAEAMPLPGGPQAEDRDCAVLRVDERGRRSASGSADADRRCWT